MKKAQAILEFTVVFVILVFFIMGLLHLWKWSSDNIIKRQIEYNATRLQAGSSTPGEPYGKSMFEAKDVSVNGYYLKKNAFPLVPKK